ncbi:MAG TPA: TonB-dependent receptor [Terriglobia bacterium]|nr:TonB-dependent receptor [Terriglobia bacterium]
MLLCCLLVLAALPLHAQNFTASLVGAVRDPSGALVPGAKVTLTNTTNGFTYSATTDTTGEYVIRNLEPSVYRLKVEVQGFKTYELSGIVLVVQQNTRQDVTLQVGSTVQTVEVTAAAPLLQSQDAQLGQVINQQFILELPLVGRDAAQLIALAPGMVVPPGWNAGNDNSINVISNGMRYDQMDVTMDGMSETSQDFEMREYNYIPSIDALEEFKVSQNNFSADQGWTGSTAVNMVMRSGTNNLHGTLYEFVRNNAFDANNFFANESASPLPALHWNDFGGTLGGPIQKNKTFFFFDFEGARETSPSVVDAGVPDAAERAGNFGELCGGDGPNGPAPDGTFNAQGMCSDPNGQLWDPYSGVYNPNYEGPVRSAFIPFNNLATYQSPGNPKLAGTPFALLATPGNLINPQAQKIMSYFAMPNYNVGTSAYNPYFNYLLNAPSPNNSNGFDIKIDRRFGDRTQVSGRLSWSHDFSLAPNCWSNAWDPCSAGNNDAGDTDIQLRGTHNFGPNKLLSVNVGYSRFWYHVYGVAAQYPNYNFVTDTGMPSYLEANGVPATPDISIGGPYISATSNAAIGQQGWTTAYMVTPTFDLLPSLDWIRGHHDIKFGGELRIEQVNAWDPGYINGNFSFSQFGTSQYPAAGGGDAMATFLTGTNALGGGNGSYSVFIRPATSNKDLSGYIQDKWRTTSKLTLNIGFRYDLQYPATERWNRLDYFNPNIDSPLQVPGVPTIMGGDQFATPANRGVYPHPFYAGIQPRLGIAYELNDKTVLRAGYAIFYSIYQFGASLGDSVDNLDGFVPVISWFTTYQNDGATPANTLADPWPGGIPAPTGNKLGAMTNVGLTPTGGVDAPGWGNMPYLQAWNAGFQRQLPGQILLDVNYAGQKGTHLLYAGYTSLQYLGPWVEQQTPAQLTELTSYVNNPFYGIITNPASCLSGPQVEAASLLVPTPQYCGEGFVEPPWSNSSYNALQIRAEKRLAQGLQFLTTYTWSKSLDDASCNGGNVCWLGGYFRVTDPNNLLHLPHSVSEFNQPQVLNVSYVYHLPFGQGLHWGSRWNPVVNGFLGGWETTGMWTFTSGQPLPLGWISCGVQIPTYGCQQPNLLAPLKKTGGPLNNWINNYFSNENTALGVPAPWTLGNGPMTLPSTYSPGANNANLAVYKNFALGKMREGASLQVRLETINGFNHPKFGWPSTTFQSPTFGQITSQANTPRQLQLGMKLYF